MVTAVRSNGSKDSSPFGKDHLNLADWRISVPTFQQTTKKDGGKVDFAEYAIEQPGGTKQRVTLESPSRVGLPTAGDEDVVIALLSLAREQEFASDIVRFVPSQLLRRMRWPLKQASFTRLERALKRLRAVTVTYRHAWYNRTIRAVAPVLITGILAEAKLTLRKGRPRKDAVPESYVQWTNNFFVSLKEGNLIDLDLDLYFGWTRPGSRHLHRHLNKVWHSGRKPRSYERDLKQLACGHLGMTDCKDLKRNFHQLIEELEQGGYLAAISKEDRYRKIRPGVWRVHLDLHPDFARSQLRCQKGTEPESSDDATDAARRLVTAYHRSRFGKEAYMPAPKEIAHAKTLLSSYEAEILEKALPTVARTVAEKFGDDLYFGAAVPYVEAALKAAADGARRRQRRDLQTAQQDASKVTERERLNQRQHRRLNLLKRWEALSESDRVRCHGQAIEQAGSNVIRQRLRRCNDLSNPPTETLEQMKSLIDSEEIHFPHLSS